MEGSNQTCIPHDLKSVVFPGGSALGITFEWTGNCLTIAEVHINDDITSSGKENLHKGDFLSFINDTDTSKMTYEEIVSLLRSIEGEERVLKFSKQDEFHTEEVKEEPAFDQSLHQDVDNLPDVHVSIISALQNSSDLRPTFVNVRNESYWYKSRKNLGGKKQMACVLEQNKQNLRWDSYMFVLKVREEDGEIAPQRKYLSTHNTRLAAIKHCENSCKERDSYPNATIAKYMDKNDFLATHFRIQIVSDRFYHMTNFERIAYVYSVLLSSMGTYPYSDNNYGKPIGSRYCPPSTLKLGSFYGSNMCHLQLFKSIQRDNSSPLSTQFEPMFIIEALTPSQWRPKIYPAPLTERFGKSHIESKSLNIELGADMKSQKNRILTLASTDTSNRHDFPGTTNTARSAQTNSAPSSPDNGSKSSSNNTLRVAPQELLGLDSAVLHNTYGKRIGGVYSHFFKDLSPGVKKMLMDQYVENKLLIQNEGARNKARNDKKRAVKQENVPKTTMSILRTKAQASMTTADYDKGTSSEKEMIEEFLIHAKKVERISIRLQRMWRIRTLFRARRYIWKREYAVLTVQRVLRGYFARLYFQLYKKLVPIAKDRIVDCYRGYRRRKMFAAWVAMVRIAMAKILPLFKRFIRKCYTRWQVRHNAAAVVIQSLLRAYIARVKVYKIHGQRYLTAYLTKHAIKIQRMIRGRRGRKIALERLSIKLVILVDIPAAILIQKIQRGIIGRQLAKLKLLQKLKAIIIQKYLLGHYYRMKYLHLKLVMLQKYAATQIQKNYRGRLDRELVKFRRHAIWYRDKFIPGVLLTQSVIRRRSAIIYVKDLKKRSKAATKIQATYRAYRSKLIYLEFKRMLLLKLKGVKAILIQTMIRGYHARRRFRKEVYKVVGRRIFAAKVILRAWVNFCARRRYETIMEEFRFKTNFEKLKKLKECREEVIKDISEISHDLHHSKTVIEKCKQRASMLDAFVVEANMRLPVIETEMRGMTGEDIDTGWGEAYGLEYEELLQQSSMAREELRLRRVQLRTAMEEKKDLQLELEDTELELDAISIKEVEAFENLRLFEIMQIESQVKRRRDRLIRVEACRWKIKSKRVKVIERKRDLYKGLAEKVKYEYTS